MRPGVGAIKSFRKGWGTQAKRVALVALLHRRAGPMMTKNRPGTAEIRKRVARVRSPDQRENENSKTGRRGKKISLLL